MALRGSLNDLGIVDLIQFPHHGKKTGELVITTPDGPIRLSYQDGAVVHATAGSASGMDALVEAVDLSQGEFEFRPDLGTDIRTIEIDLHRALMTALKLRDERNALRNASQVADSNADVLQRRLGDFLASTVQVLHVCILEFNGEALVQATRGGETLEGIEELHIQIHDVQRNHPRPGLRRLLMEDELGTVAVQFNGDGQASVLLAEQSMRMGAVTVALGKLTSMFENGTPE